MAGALAGARYSRANTVPAWTGLCEGAADAAMQAEKLFEAVYPEDSGKAKM